MLFLLALWLAGPPPPAAGVPAVLHPVWRARVLDREGARKLAHGSHDGRPKTGLAFMEDGRLVVYAVIPTRPRLEPQAQPGSAWQLRLSLREPSDGAETDTRAWPTAPISGVFTDGAHASRGGLVVQTSETLHFLSARLATIKDWNAPELSPEARSSNEILHGWGHTRVSVSPTRKTVLVYRGTRDLPGYSQVCELDGVSFSIRRCLLLDASISWPDTPVSDQVLFYGPGLVSLSGAPVHLGCVPAPQFVPTAGACTIAGQQVGPGMILGDGRFLTIFQLHPGIMSDALALGSFGGGGQVLLAPSRTEYVDRFSGSRVDEAGKLAAVTVLRVHPGSAFWDTGDKTLGQRIAIFDLDTKQQVATTEWLPPAKENYDFQISPDGARIAVLEDGEVMMFEIKPARQ